MCCSSSVASGSSLSCILGLASSSRCQGLTVVHPTAPRRSAHRRTRVPMAGVYSGAVAADIRKLKEEAQRAIEKGKWKKAAELYDEVARAQPEDTGALHRAGESYRKLGKPDEAVARFEREAALYARQGFLIKAIAICKLILEIDPSHTKTQETLAHLYAEQRAQAGPSKPP